MGGPVRTCVPVWAGDPPPIHDRECPAQQPAALNPEALQTAPANPGLCSPGLESA